MGNDMMNMVMIGGLLLVGGMILMNPGMLSNLMPAPVAAVEESMEDAGVICQDESGEVIGCPDDLGTGVEDEWEVNEEEEDIDKWKTCPEDWKDECKAAGKLYNPPRKCKAKAVEDPNDPELEVCNCSCKAVDAKDDDDDKDSKSSGRKSKSGGDFSNNPNYDKKKYQKKVKKQQKKHDKFIKDTDPKKDSRYKGKSSKEAGREAAKKLGLFGMGFWGLAGKKVARKRPRRIVKRFLPKPIVTTKTRPYNALRVTAF